MGAIMQKAWDHLLPGIHDEALAPNKEATKSLSDRIANLELPKVDDELDGENVKPNGRASGTRYVFGENDLGVKSIRFSLEDGESQLVIVDENGEYTFPLGMNGWHRSRVPAVGPLIDRIPNADDVGVATHAVWTESDTLHSRIWLYESPYRVDIAARFEADAVHLDVKRNVGWSKKSFELKGTAE